MLKTVYTTILACLGGILLQGCSPIYKTSYIYHPVLSEASRSCANVCLTQKQTCRRECHDLQRRCVQEANTLAIASGLLNDRSMDAPGAAKVELLRDCDKQTEACEWSCEQTHKECHEQCGGEVTLQTSCVQNCH